jgi:hypothetical protein
MGEALFYAVGVAVSPVPIGASVLLLTCSSPTLKGTSFAAGWTLGVAACAGVLVAAVDSAGLSDSDPLWIALPELLLGAAFVAAAIAVWMRRRRPRAQTPRWLEAVETFTPLRFAAVGVVLSAANPKVVALSLGAALALANADTSTAGTAWTVGLFAAIAAVGVVAPLAIYLVVPARAGRLLGRLRAWLVGREAAVLTALGLLIGTLFVVDGVGALR